MNTDATIELSIVMPCLNEAETLAGCIQKAKKFLGENKIVGEIIVSDNGSTDGSQEITIVHGARLVHAEIRGYGSALMEGIKAAQGKFIIAGDPDGSHDFSSLKPFLEKFRSGYDLVMGNRFKGGIQKGAMPFLHQYFGVPILSFLGRLFFRTRISDFHCGLRGFTKEAIIKMDLRTTGMEFASEMIVKASLMKMRIAEIPVILSPAGRNRPSHLRTWRDGWRHLRFLLMYSPGWLFLYPGFLLILSGIILSIVFMTSHSPHSYSLLYTSAAAIIGFQCVFFYLFTRIFAMNEGLLPEEKRFMNLFNYVTLETGVISGMIILLAGIGLTMIALNGQQKNLGEFFSHPLHLKKIIPLLTCIIIGVQLILYSFFLSILGLKKRK